MNMASKRTASEAIQIMIDSGLEPLEPYKSGNNPWKCRCLKCESIVTPSLKSIINRSKETKFCRFCKPNAPLNPELAKQFMLENQLEPLVPFPGSAAKWKCKCMKCNKEVFPSYGSIKRGQGGCIYCAGQIVNPTEAAAFFEANKLKPLVEYPGAGKPWRSIHTVCGKEVTPTYSNIRSGHTGCKFCVGNIADEEKARAYFIARDLLPLEPYKNALSDWKSLHTVCGKVVTPRFNTVQQGSSGCMYCAGNAPIDPVDAHRLYVSKDLEPLEPFKNSSSPWKSKHIPCGTIVRPRYNEIRVGKVGCPVCSRTVIDPAAAEKLVTEKGFEILESYLNSSTPWRMRHIKCGRIVTPAYNSIQQGGSGCAYCAGNKVDVDEAMQLMHSRALIPLVPFPGSNVPWKSQHARCGREISPRYGEVLKGGNGCSYCAGIMVDPLEAEGVFIDAGFEPLEPYPGSDRGWRSRHVVCGREIAPRYTYVRRLGTGCPYCSLRKVDPQDAIDFLEANSFEPLANFPGTNAPWPMKHTKCGKEIAPRFASLKNGGGCKYCAESSFDYQAPATLYLITHEQFCAHKIGIGNSDKNRVKQHQSYGWKVFKTLDFTIGDDAYRVEQDILTWLLDEYGLTPFLSKEEMPQGGYTETVDASEIDLPTIWKKVETLTKSKQELSI
jgi:recombinational DNA repair protein (RecF pathway)